MTASTEQERAEFEARLPNAYRQPQETYTVHNMEVAFIAGMQAARRAQVVPQDLIEAAQAVVERWDSPLWKDLPAVADYIARLRKALAAAPLPPEAACNPSMQPELATNAAPVQMPEPAGWVDDGGMLFWTEDTPPDGENIYTEHQVRQLLAAHGTGKDKA